VEVVLKLEKPNKTVMLEGRLSVLQHKILNGIFHVLRGRFEDEHCDEHSLREMIYIPYEWVTNSSLQGGGNRADFEKAGKEIFKTVFEEKAFYDITPEGVSVETNCKTMFHAIEWIRYEWESRRFGVKLGTYFLQRCEAFFLTSGFVTLPVAEVVPLESIYSLRFYELLKEYSEVERCEIVKPVSWIRKWLTLGDKYKLFKDFRVRVLEQAHREINSKTNLRYEFELVKRGRVVESVRFYDIEYRSVVATPPALPAPAPAPDYSESEKLLISAGVEGAAVQQIAQSFPDVAFIRSLIAGASKIKNPAGYIVSKAGERWREWGIRQNAKTAPKTGENTASHSRASEKIENDRKQARREAEMLISWSDLPDEAKNAILAYKNSPDGGWIMFTEPETIYKAVASRLHLDPETGKYAIQQDFTEISSRGMGVRK